ncbi:MAG: DUF2795 domain-containing protein [Actinobacteria bacterium]|nr:DUF2795 domain-containing protein [Actinomycetota bacterium]
MDIQGVAELQSLLEGIDLPAEKQELIAYASAQRPRPHQLAALQALPDREYDTIDEVGETLVRVQPPRVHEVPHEPREESGAPPGGDAYTTRA